jgi:O-antigen/teichoic acid export membrane protein
MIDIGMLIKGAQQGLDPGTRRSHLLKLAMISGGLSKLSSLLLQGLAIPLVYHALGPHQYALYLLLTAALATITLMQMGAGPGLTASIAKAHAEVNQFEQSGILASAVAFVLGTALLGAAGVWITLHFVPVTTLFGSNFAADRAEILHAANVCLIVITASVVLSVVDSTLAGYQEQGFSNLGNCAANLVSAGLLIPVCYYGHPSIAQVILILYGASGLSRLVNLALLVYRRPYLLKGMAHMTRRSTAAMASVGTAFWLIEAACMIEQSGGTYIMAHLTTIHATDVFGLTYKSVSLVASGVGIVTQPLWPSFADALARQDFAWIQRIARRTRKSLMTAAGAVTVCLLLGGGSVFARIVHVRIDTGLLSVLAVYLFFNIWTHYHYVLLEGLDRVWVVTGIIGLENALMLLFGVLLVPLWGAMGMACSYLFASLVGPVWALPRILSTRLSELRDETEPMRQAAQALATLIHPVSESEVII